MEETESPASLRPALAAGISWSAWTAFFGMADRFREMTRGSGGSRFVSNTGDGGRGISSVLIRGTSCRYR
ncbi:MAG TPA: hypothetical protein PKY80_04355 [Syntrophales bacterium]|nr:hypothetical protein [Syntrophales bacterium]